jgi:hypothetical protein
MMMSKWAAPFAPSFRPIAKIRHPWRNQDQQRPTSLIGQQQMGGLTQTFAELFFINTANFGAVASTSSETSLLGTNNEQPWIPPGTFDQGNRAYGRTILIEARGTFSTTSTPTMIFQVRLGSTIGSSYLSGTSVGVSGTITSQSGVSNKFWDLRLMLTCRVPGQGSGNTTLHGAGYVSSYSGFASPFFYPLEPTTPDTATWTSTIDNSVSQYVNLSMTWGTSSSSNTITCQTLAVWCLN